MDKPNLEDIGLTNISPPFTTREVYDAIITAAPAMNAAWQAAVNDDSVWRERAKHYGWLRTWLLRWQLKRV
jgi:hypothetical protein